MQYGFLRKLVLNLLDQDAMAHATNTFTRKLWQSYTYAAQQIYDKFLWKHLQTTGTLTLTSGLGQLPYAAALAPIQVIDADGENVPQYTEEWYRLNKEAADAGEVGYYETIPSTTALSSHTYTAASAPTTTTMTLGDSPSTSYIGSSVLIDGAYLFIIANLSTTTLTIDKAYNDIFSKYDGTSMTVKIEPAGCRKLQFFGNYASSYTIRYAKRFYPAYNDADDTGIPEMFDNYIASFVASCNGVIRSETGESRANAERQAAVELERIKNAVFKDIQPPNIINKELIDKFSPLSNYGSNTLSSIISGRQVSCYRDKWCR